MTPEENRNHNDALKLAFTQGLEAAAQLAYNWTSKPPRADGQRALLATAIRNIKYDSTSK